jgi:hypothetical protein
MSQRASDLDGFSSILIASVHNKVIRNIPEYGRIFRKIFCSGYEVKSSVSLCVAVLLKEQWES